MLGCQDKITTAARWWLLVLCIALLGVLPLRGYAETSALKALPWHLVDYRYNLPSESRDGIPFETLAVTLDFAGQARRGDFFYLAALYGKIDGNGFYFGLQTDLHDGGQRSQNQAKGNYLEPGVIFSRWGNSDAFNARPAAGGWTVVPGPNTPYEGQTLSVRHLLPWQAGRYRFELHSTPAAPPLRGVWLALRLRAEPNGDWQQGGSLYFPTITTKPHLDPRPVTFAEVYGRPSSLSSLESLAATLPTRTLTLHPLELDGRLFAPKGTPVQPPGVPGHVSVVPDRAAQTGQTPVILTLSAP